MRTRNLLHQDEPPARARQVRCRECEAGPCRFATSIGLQVGTRHRLSGIVEHAHTGRVLQDRSAIAVCIEGQGKVAKPKLDDPDPGFGSGVLIDPTGVILTFCAEAAGQTVVMAVRTMAKA